MSSLNDEYREVNFETYCKKCRYRSFPEEADPCVGCLAEPMNEESSKPVNYKELDPYNVGMKFSQELTEEETKYVNAISHIFDVD